MIPKQSLIITHENPDIDGVASSLALYNEMRLHGIKCDVFIPDYRDDSFEDMPFSDCLLYLEDIRKIFKKDYDTVFIVDMPGIDNLPSVIRNFIKKRNIVVIDHHDVGSKYQYFLTVKDINASSTAEVMYKFLKASHSDLDKKTYELLYMGLLSDSAMFLTQKTTYRTHLIVSEILSNISYKRQIKIRKMVVSSLPKLYFRVIDWIVDKYIVTVIKNNRKVIFVYVSKYIIELLKDMGLNRKSIMKNIIFDISRIYNTDMVVLFIDDAKEKTVILSSLCELLPHQIIDFSGYHISYGHRYGGRIYTKHSFEKFVNNVLRSKDKFDVKYGNNFVPFIIL
ncbi:MAG: DHH family phosphoesterase [Candidatus Methanomethylicia archaeon]